MKSEPNCKVLSLASTYPRWTGDTEPRFVHQLNRHLQASFDMTALAPHASGIPQHETIDGIQVHRFRYAPSSFESLAYEGGILSNLKRSRWKWLLVPFFFLAQVAAIRKLVRAGSFDVVHAHWIIPQGLAAVVALKTLPGRKPALLCTSHGGDLYAFDGLLGRWIKRWVIGHCQSLTVVSGAMKRDAAERFDNLPSVSTIPMGTDAARLFRPPAERPTRGRVLFVGRLVEKKGAGYLLSATARLASKYPYLTLDIVGDGPLKTALQAEARHLGIEHRVRFLGAVSHDEVATRMKACDIFAMPAVRAESGDQEGFGLVITEALACECAVIASDLPPIRDIIIDDRTGLMVEPMNITRLAEGMDTLLNDPALRKKLGAAGRRHVETHFDWNIIADRYKQLLISIIRDRPQVNE